MAVSEEVRLVPVSNAIDNGKKFAVRQLRHWGIIAASLALMASFSLQVAAMYAGGLVLLIAVTTIRYQRQARRFMVANANGIAALARGDLSEARAIFWAWAETTKLPRASAIARHNLAWTLMRQGAIQQSIDILLDNETRNLRALKAVGMFPTSAIDLALDHALLGDLTSAETWCAETEERRDELSNPTLPAMKVFARAVIDCRSGREAEAARMLDDRWAECEATLVGETLRPLRIVRAFALAAAGPRDAGLADAIVAAARPVYPGEYAFLGTAWPEMATFLTTHGL